jgi:triacylglycerol esterase/lipase EstA (alpha/beta hydrolase family)
VGRLAAMSPQRRRFVLAASGVVAVAVLATVVPPLVNRLTQSSPTGFPAQDRPGTVLLVPGYGGSTDSLTTLAERIRATGRQAVVVQLPDSATGDLTVQADALDNAVEAALRGAPSVDVVGYSAGGVVTRLWVEEHDGAAKARRVITFGSPYHGTTVAGAADAADPGVCPTACQELVPGSSLLTRLAGQAPQAGHPPWLSLWTTQDQTVVPPDSAELAGALDASLQSVCADDQSSHGGLPTDPLVVGIVLSELSAGTMTTPAAADCASLRALGGS